MNTTLDEQWMRFALNEAHNAYDSDEVPVGAVVVVKNKIIARGYNMTEKLQDPTAHAEMIAITAATNFLGSKYLTEATIYITLEPCAMCAGALYWSKIARVVYGAYDNKNGFSKCAEPSIIFHPQTKVEGGVLVEESTAMLRNFFEQKRNR